MTGCFADGFGIVVRRHNFPDGNAVPHDISLASPDAVTKADAGEFLLQRFFLQVETAQRGYFQMAPSGLSGEQDSIPGINSA